MKKVIILEENEVEALIKNVTMSKAIISTILNSMDKNIQDENMGLSPINVSEFYSKLQTVKIAIDDIEGIFES